MFARLPINHERPATMRYGLLLAASFAVLLFISLLGLAGCGSPEGTSGANFSSPKKIEEASFHSSSATGAHGALIDTSCASQGYIAAKASNSSRLKLQITLGDQSINHDLPNDGTVAIYPLTFGDGDYGIRVMQNTSGSNYVELYRTQKSVTLESEFAPFLRPNLYCEFSNESAAVKKARELVADTENVGDAVEAICTYVVDNINYDDAKAKKVAKSTGYLPDPDSTLSSGKGICFDYASLGAAMLRSQGIPAKIVTGYVSPDNIYHAWIMVYIDGTWTSAQFSVEQNTWSRVDLTFAASSDNTFVGDGKDYQDRYTY